MEKLIKAVVFVIFGVLILRTTENILEKKWNYPGDYEDVPKIINQFYSLEENSLDAVFLGKSSVKLAVSPIQIYQNSNILTYNLASSAQPIQLSYYLLGEVYKRQKPAVVFLDVSELFRENKSEDYSWHFIMDNMPVSRGKIEAAVSYAEQKADKQDLYSFTKDFFSIISPLYYYHARWDELTKNDFIKQDEGNYYYAAGQYMTSLVSGTSLTYENVDSEINVMNALEGAKKEYSGDTYREYEIDGKLYDVTINQEADEYIREIKSLCDKYNSRLVLIKIPTIGMPQINHTSWSYDKYVMAKNFCDEMGVSFLDLVYDESHTVEINWREDTIDGGAHLNTRGAKKVTDCITDYLENQKLEPGTDELYYQCSKDYDRVERICMLQSEFHFDEYVNRIMEDENYTVIISAQNDFQASLSEEVLSALKRLGLQSGLKSGVRDSFIGIIDCKQVIYEAVSNRRMEYSYDLPGGSRITVVSSGLNTGSYSSINIDGKEYSTNMCGLNFVIFDKSTNLIVDSVNFNISASGAVGYRNKNVTLKYLAQYKQIINSQK